MHRLIVLALITGLLAIPASQPCADDFTRSKDDLERAYERLVQSVQDINVSSHGAQGGVMVFCVCKDDRSKIMYRAKTISSGSVVGMHLDWLRQAAEKAKGCGGCFAEPTVRIVRP